MKHTNRKILYFSPVDWAFCIHHLAVARAAREAGHDVVVVTRVIEHAAPILAAGLRLIPLEISRDGIAPLRELLTLFQLYKIYRKEHPDLVHHFAIKPMLYGSIASILAKVPATINGLIGLGFVFTSERTSARLLRPLVIFAMRIFLNRQNSRVTFQNSDDLRILTAKRIIDPAKARLILGSGVNIEAFTPSAEPEGDVTVIMPARLLLDKGVNEFVCAARLLKARGVQARFALVGDRDIQNPATVPQSTIEKWREEGTVEIWGWRTDMAQVYRECHVVCLPSYREGFPMVLLEAAACGRPLVSTDVEGCREAVVHNYSGLLVPARNATALAEALADLINNPAKRMAFGANARAIVVKEFSIPVVINHTFAVYREVLPT